LARIRTIKPEFPISETIGRLSREARLLYIQLWTVVDDSGRCRGSSRLLASQLYPFDDDAVALMDDWLAELEKYGCVDCYSIDDTAYLELPKWLKHQKIDRPSPSRLPPNPRKIAKPREPSAPLPRTVDLGSRTEEDIPPPSEVVNFEVAIRAWNLLSERTGLKQVRDATDNRRRAWEKHFSKDITRWHQILGEIEASEFLQGSTGWKVTFDWILKPANATKLVEGNYENKKPKVDSAIRQAARNVSRRTVGDAGGPFRSPTKAKFERERMGVENFNLPRDIIVLDGSRNGGGD
jgi:hypothetical protein